MNFIFGIIVLALLIIAVRVIWATLLQTLVFLKSGLQVLQQRMAKQALRASAPVIMPCLPHPVEWDIMADSLRHEIHRRNTGVSREADRLDAQLQVKLKTMELFKADIQIAKLEQELLKIKPAVVLQEPETGKKRRPSKQDTSEVLDTLPSTRSHQVQQLRAALKGGNIKADASTQNVRH
ncbi:hypothetical protein KKZ03_13745 [Methylobacter sp. S3L5C]|nr:hypothetical protein KKZ03_13745 [Methylobacter sp. S3L5C]